MSPPLANLVPLKLGEEASAAILCDSCAVEELEFAEPPEDEEDGSKQQDKGAKGKATKKK